MTKKEFKELCSFHQYGGGQKKRNAIYFDWKSDKGFAGFKFMVKCMVMDATRSELFNVLYNWVTKEEQPPWWVEYKFAHDDEHRFKVSLVG